MAFLMGWISLEERLPVAGDFLGVLREMGVDNWRCDFWHGAELNLANNTAIVGTMPRSQNAIQER